MKHLKILSSLMLIAFVMAACSHSTPTASVDEKARVTAVVESFGKKLASVSLLAPTVAADIRAQYADYIAPALLDQWAGDPTQAPGRLTSSPWPERIELISITRVSAGEYAVTGSIIEVTSVEVNTGGAAAEIPVQLTVQKDAQGHWLITDFQQG
jgi:hypothetical protein